MLCVGTEYDWSGDQENEWINRENQGASTAAPVI